VQGSFCGIGKLLYLSLMTGQSSLRFVPAAAISRYL
jgi:hypothetical protein